jgi:ABC-type antimicrobial peptide transport system permease subunit
VGLGLIIALHKVLARWSIGNASDPIILWIVTVVLLAITGAAALIPANRAASIQPAGALRID